MVRLNLTKRKKIKEKRGLNQEDKFDFHNHPS